MSEFNDHFSGHAASYASHRPSYPDAVYRAIADAAPATTAALDVATGNGQAALGLAAYFDRVVALDASAAQVDNAAPHERVTYGVAPAEATGQASGAFDVVTVAQALHWFDHGRFFDEVARVLRPGGLFVAWTYQLFRVAPDVDAIIAAFYDGPIGPYWPAERRHVEVGYRDIALPWPALPFALEPMRLSWSADQACAYLRTWSATQRYIADRGEDPLAATEPALRDAWGSGAREVVWPLPAVATRKPG